MAEQLLLDLLPIAGVSGKEGAVMEYLVAKLRAAAGVPAAPLTFDQVHRRSPHGGEVGNLVLQTAGQPARPRRLLMAHADTVPICQGCSRCGEVPCWCPAIRIAVWGPMIATGVCGGCLATALRMSRAIAPSALVLLLDRAGGSGVGWVPFGTVGNARQAGIGLQFRRRASHRLTVGATGGYRMAIHIQGIASHAGVAPEARCQCYFIAALAIETLRQEGWLGRIEKGGRTGTSNVGTIEGGEASNVVAPRAMLAGSRHAATAAFRGRIVKAIQAAFRQAVAP